MSKKKWTGKEELTPKMIQECGLLFEANRTLFHLFGIALTVCEDEEGESWFELQDARDDPEGFIFEPKTFEAGEKKLKKFMEDWGYEYLGERQRRLGSGCQTRANITRAKP